MKHVSRHKGFTLIEVMIVVGIVAILAAIAIPSYNEYVVKSKRAKAAGCLLEVAQFMERNYTSNNTYVTAIPNLPCRTELETAPASYNFSFAAGFPTARTYTVQAVPQGAQAAADDECATLTINQAGIKTESGTQDVRYCWK